MKKQRSVLRILLVILCVLLGIILAAGIALTALAYYWTSQIPRIEVPQETLTPEQIQQIMLEETVPPDAPTAPVLKEEDVDWGEKEGETIEASRDVINILLIGQDARPGEIRARSDSMILVTFNTKEKTITMTSFLRDLYVQIPGYQDNKMNAAYAFGGMPLLNQTLEQNFGVQVDGNVEVDFSRFSQVIDALGGVDLEIREDEAVVINQGTGRSELSAGMMHLDGEQALCYSRIRYLDADADFSRTNRQRKVINALIEKFRDAELTELVGMLYDLLPMIATDMSSTEIIKLATELFPMLKDCTIISQRIPADGAYTLNTIRGMSCVVADMDAARELLEQTIGGEKIP